GVMLSALCTVGEFAKYVGRGDVLSLYAYGETGNAGNVRSAAKTKIGDVLSALLPVVSVAFTVARTRPDDTGTPTMRPFTTVSPVPAGDNNTEYDRPVWRGSLKRA